MIPIYKVEHPYQLGMPAPVATPVYLQEQYNKELHALNAPHVPVPVAAPVYLQEQYDKELHALKAQAHATHAPVVYLQEQYNKDLHATHAPVAPVVFANGPFHNIMGLGETSVAPVAPVAPVQLQELAAIPAGTAKGKSLATKSLAVAKARNTVGNCYAAVADAVDATIAVFLYGNSAYMAADQFAKRAEFTEIKGLAPTDLPKLPAGAIVVWGQTSASPHGHIAVAQGNGQESSDFVGAQHTNLRGFTNFRVFMPK